MIKEKLINDLENQYIKKLTRGLKSAIFELVRSVKAVDDNVLESNFLYGTFPSNFEVSNMKRITIIKKIIEVLREKYPGGTPVKMKSNNNYPLIPIDRAISNVSSELEKTALTSRPVASFQPGGEIMLAIPNRSVATVTVEDFLEKIREYKSSLIEGKGTDDMANDLVRTLYKIDEKELSDRFTYVIKKTIEMFEDVIGKKPMRRQENLLHFFTETMRGAIQRDGRILNRSSKGLQIVNIKLAISEIFKL